MGTSLNRIFLLRFNAFRNSLGWAGFEGAEEVSTPSEPNLITRIKAHMQVLIVWATLGKRKLNFMALFYRALYLLLFGHVQYPSDFGCVSLKFGAAHNSTAAHCDQIAAPKVIYPKAENWAICVIF
ncbi:hypothetical protein J3D48_004726 [Pseudomonas fluorescens]|jgi:hypothetical protein|nr:hypothetical protein AK821_19445 [Pseudomonas sp. RIT-PI-r]MCP1488413.1 hypothetical protein [Pseudomonas fluorescens]